MYERQASLKEARVTLAYNHYQPECFLMMDQLIATDQTL